MNFCHLILGQNWLLARVRAARGFSNVHCLELAVRDYSTIPGPLERSVLQSLFLSPRAHSETLTAPGRAKSWYCAANYAGFIRQGILGWYPYLTGTTFGPLCAAISFKNRIKQTHVTVHITLLIMKKKNLLNSVILCKMKFTMYRRPAQGLCTMEDLLVLTAQG